MSAKFLYHRQNPAATSYDHNNLPERTFLQPRFVHAGERSLELMPKLIRKLFDRFVAAKIRQLNSAGRVVSQLVVALTRPEEIFLDESLL